MSTSERDTEVQASILRNLGDVARTCEQLAAEADTDSAADMHLAALRYRQLAARAMGVWAETDALTALTANAAHDRAWDAETEACDAQDTEELPRVHS